MENIESYLKQLYSITSPEDRAAYYCKHINTSAIDLGTAENVLLLDFYKENILNRDALEPVNKELIKYASPIFGKPEFRNGVIQLLSKSWGVDNLETDNIYAVSGVSAALECLAFALFQKGDNVITPAPLWYGFPWSLVDRPGLNFHPFQIEKNNGCATFELTLEDVRKAYNSLVPSPKLLILTNPNNPLGINYPKELLEEIYHWVLYSTDMHIISDEIYGFSQITPNQQNNTFRSGFTLDVYKEAEAEKQRRVHLVWGLAKDFGLSGFRVGFVMSKSNRVKQAMAGTNTTRTMSWFSPVNSLTQHILKPLFVNKNNEADPTLAIEAMNEYSGDKNGGNLLTTQFNKTKEHLDKGGIKYIPQPTSAIFFWLDLREYLDPDCNCPNWKKEKLHPNIDPQENKLAMDIKQNANLVLIPGMECYNKEPGYFRLCYTAQDINDVTKGIDNLAAYLKSLNNSVKF